MSVYKNAVFALLQVTIYDPNLIKDTVHLLGSLAFWSGNIKKKWQEQMTCLHIL